MSYWFKYKEILPLREERRYVMPTYMKIDIDVSTFEKKEYYSPRYDSLRDMLRTLYHFIELVDRDDPIFSLYKDNQYILNGKGLYDLVRANQGIIYAGLSESDCQLVPMKFWFKYTEVEPLAPTSRPYYLKISNTLSLERQEYYSPGYDTLREMVDAFYELMQLTGEDPIINFYFGDQYIENGETLYRYMWNQKNGRAFPKSGLCPWNCKMIQM